jgi:hypothetical protein
VDGRDKPGHDGGKLIVGATVPAIGCSIKWKPGL